MGILRSSSFPHLIWDEESRKIFVADLLRVHDWSYVSHIQEACNRIPDTPAAIGGLDGDTAISHGTYEAALVAAGAVCHGVDMIMGGKVRGCLTASVFV
jgi:acetoin utilization deacetylase AcuC-like enzyme